MAPGKIDPDYSDLNKSGVNFTMSKKLGGKRYTCGSTKSLGFVKKKKKSLTGQDEQTEID